MTDYDDREQSCASRATRINADSGALTMIILALPCTDSVRHQHDGALLSAVGHEGGGLRMESRAARAHKVLLGMVEGDQPKGRLAGPRQSYNCHYSRKYHRELVEMIISHTHKFIFIKSFKTAGTSIESTLSNHCSGEDIVTPINDYRHNRNEKGEFIHKAMNAEEFVKLNLDHLQHVEALVIKNHVSPEVWKNYFKFSIARNPWDRVVSYFFWEKRNDPELKPRKRFYNYLGIPFDELEQVRELFSNFIKQGNWPSNDNFYVIENKLCVDYVIRYESLRQDFDEVCKRLNLPTDSLPKLKGGIRQSRYHYSDYYDDESIKIVEKQHENDLRLFGYKFERN